MVQLLQLMNQYWYVIITQDVQDAAEKDWKDLATGQTYSLHKHGDKRDADVSGDIEIMVMLEAQFLHER